MKKRAVYAVLSISLSLLSAAPLFGLQEEGRHERQFTLRKVINPDSAKIELHEVLKNTDRTTDTANSRTTEPADSLFSDFEGFKAEEQPFGKRPAFIPFWQMSSLIKEEIRTKERAIVGGGSFYLPQGLSREEKGVSIALLKEIIESENIEDYRVELELSSVPAQRIRSRTENSIDSLRAEQVSDSGSSLRFALYPAKKITGEKSRGFEEVREEEEGPIAVVQAEVHRYTQGFSAGESMRRGDTVKPSALEPSPVPITKAELRRSRDRDKKEVFSEGFDSGYEYTLKRDVEAGDIIKSSNIKTTAPVERGDRVACRFEKGSLVLTIEGRAASSGGNGDLVRVRLSTGKVREFRVVGKGEVHKNLSGAEG
ncbi:MAG: flagellar basal body P-ring formation chaperone FlgA [Spirochaetia bacterium]